MAGNGSITPDTKISLKLVAGLITLLLAMGVGWFNLRMEIRDLRDMVENGMRDRWTRVDDRVHMATFATVNSLRMPDHERVTE